MELYINHDGLKRYALRIKRAKDSYLAKLDELSKGCCHSLFIIAIVQHSIIYLGWCQFFGRVTESKVHMDVPV